MRTCFAVLLTCLIVGCGGQPEFVHRAEFDDLAPYAQEYVNQVLDAHFGEPTDMVVWERLPLHLHAAVGVVVREDAIDTDEGERAEGDSGESDSEDNEEFIVDPIRDVQIDLALQSIAIEPGTEVLWPADGGDNVRSSWIREWEADESVAKLDNAVATANGDDVIIGPGQVLVHGRLLYAEHCQHCHGVTGDGNGPTAPYLNPKPRDYRLGVFKFTTTERENRAARTDLMRVLDHGIPGTYMPSFKLLTEDEMTAIVEYVLWLSMRGELEYQLVSLLVDEGYSSSVVSERIRDGEKRADIKQSFIERVDDPDDLAYEVETLVDRIATNWESSQEEDALIQPVTPRVPYSAESIAKGRELYLQEALKCAQCHGEAGYGNGIQTHQVMKNSKQEDYPVPGLHDDWGNPIVPRNLHAGIYRGGRRPIDLYSRIYAGIKGTPMPPFKNLVRPSDPDDPSSELTDEDIWHLVNYIYSVPINGHEPVSDPEIPNDLDVAAN